MKEILQFDNEYLWHPYAALRKTPARFLALSAKGTKIQTAEGLELIDAVSSWWCMAHGHNAPEIVEAIQAQSRKMCHVMFGGFTHEPAIELGEKLVSFLPKGLNKIFYADSGSIAVECAAKMAVQYQYARSSGKVQIGGTQRWLSWRYGGRYGFERSRWNAHALSGNYAATLFCGASLFAGGRCF